MMNKLEVKDWVWIDCAAVIICPYCGEQLYLMDIGEIKQCKCGKKFMLDVTFNEICTESTYTQEEILKQYDKKE